MQEVSRMPLTSHTTHSSTDRHPKAKPQGRVLTVLLLSLAALAVIIPLSGFSLGVILFEQNRWNLPGIFVYDQSVAWKNPEETAALVDRAWNEDRQVRLTSSALPGEGLWVSPADLGYWVDSQATAQKASAFGRSAAPFTDLQAALTGEQQVVLPVIYFDETLARQTLDAVADELNIAPENARVVFQDGSWRALPGSTGRRVDVDATLQGLFENAFTNLVAGSALLVIQPVQPEISDLSPLLDEIDALLSQELALQAYDPIRDDSLTWSVPDEIKHEWLSIDAQSGAVSFAIPQKAIQKLVQDWEADLGPDRSLASLPEYSVISKTWEQGEQVKGTIIHNPTHYQVVGGESLWSISLKLGMPMWHILDANPGLTTSNIAAGMTLTIPSQNVLLPLPPVEHKRIMIDISDQRMTVYENGQVRNTFIISTGMSDSPTMPGIFQIQSHEINAYASNWDLYMPHFMGIYEAWPGFMNGIHGLPLLSNGQRLWASSLGSPASYGCIILDLGAAEDLYTWADPGVVVEITR